jgi:hypothetical protein
MAAHTVTDKEGTETSESDEFQGRSRKTNRSAGNLCNIQDSFGLGEDLDLGEVLDSEARLGAGLL